MLRRERLHSVEHEKQLHGQRLLAPQRAIVVEGAMRSGTGTKSGELGFVTFSTKVMMDCLAGPSFHEGNGSAASATVAVRASTQAKMAARKVCIRFVFMVAFLQKRPYLIGTGAAQLVFCLTP
jgi:hypothetical protein